MCQNTFRWTKTSYNHKKWGDRGFGYFRDYVSGAVFYWNIAYNMGDMGFTVFKEWEDQGQTVIMNNLVVGSIRTVSLGGASKTQTSKVTIKNNNIFVDSGVFGQVLSRDKSETPFEKFDVNNNHYYCYGWAGEKHTTDMCVFEDSKNNWRLAHTFEELHSIAPSWETTEYNFYPKYGDYEST